MNRCTPAFAFGGGKVRMVQYVDGNFDVDVVC